MLSEEKLKIVRDFLKSQFPDYELADKYDFSRMAQTFRLTTVERFYLITVLRKFLDDHNASEIKKILERSKLDEYLNRYKKIHLIITSSGVKTEKLE